MAPRPTRAATITFGLVAIPVRFYTATRQEDISFNLLHGECGGRVNRKWFCSKCDRLLENDETIRGYEIAKGRFVTFTDAELDELESDGDRALEITEFVGLDQVDPVFYEKSWFLGPGEGGAKTYRLLAAALKRQNKVALARWVSGTREHLVLLRPFDNGIILHQMYYADEVRDFGALEVEEAPVADKELKLAEMLINELTEETFDPLRYKDEYRARVLERIEAKSQGQVIISEPEQAKGGGEVVDIMEALRRSLAGAERAPRRAAAMTARAPRPKSQKRAAEPKRRSSGR